MSKYQHGNTGTYETEWGSVRDGFSDKVVGKTETTQEREARFAQQRVKEHEAKQQSKQVKEDVRYWKDINEKKKPAKEPTKQEMDEFSKEQETKKKEALKNAYLNAKEAYAKVGIMDKFRLMLWGERLKREEKYKNPKDLERLQKRYERYG